MKKTIGIIIFTKIGTKTSILAGEFEFWNTFKKFNPDIDFVFIAISKFTNKSILENKKTLDFPVSILNIYNNQDLHKLEGLSGVFSYLTRNNFFGGAVDRSCVMNYNICSYCTNELNIPLFIRTPDSEYPYYDYKKLIDNRINGKSPAAKKFKELNNHTISIVTEKYIDYKRTYFIANGSRKIYDWIPDVTVNDIGLDMRVVDEETVKKNSIYVSDEYLHNVNIYRERYDYLPNKSTKNRLLFIGYLKGSVASGRIKVFNKMFKTNDEFPPIDIIGPGAEDLKINKDSVNKIDKSIFGKEFFETLNSYLGYIFIGKGNPINKYINKTVYDCLAAKCPIIVYSPCDTTQLIFKNREFYFETPEDLFIIYEKLKDEKIRNRWIDEQRIELETILKKDMEPMFKFSDFCEFNIGLKPEIKINPLF